MSRLPLRNAPRAIGSAHSKRLSPVVAGLVVSGLACNLGELGFFFAPPARKSIEFELPLLTYGLAPVPTAPEARK